jgi:hypothetical protein
MKNHFVYFVLFGVNEGDLLLDSPYWFRDR